ncbi:MAG: Flp pilus assembly complex ATPase component TadA [Candidatus Levybacteria bacterium]|jgi:Flp pilus assembly CpaF family ATPase|nr:Flp pilus assembly complex ATPase component TadA [Candidatus Levybacteria bacterium]
MDPVLEGVLFPLLKFLDPEYIAETGLMEINCNEPGKIWLEYSDQGYESVHIPELTISFWGRLCNVLAACSGQFYDAYSIPIVSAKLPYGHRFEGMVNSASETGLSVSIRMQREAPLSFSDFGLTKMEADFLVEKISTGANIVISGGTSSGKTTLANLLVKHIPLEKRIFLIEDTRELNIPHENKLSFVVARNDREGETILGYERVIDHAMRSRPDQILLGEISIKNAHPCLLLLNTGHKGLLTTIHSNSPDMVLDEGFYQRIELAGKQIDRESLSHYLRKVIDVIVQVHKTSSGTREVTEIWTNQTQSNVRGVQLLKAA